MSCRDAPDSMARPPRKCESPRDDTLFEQTTVRDERRCLVNSCATPVPAMPAGSFRVSSLARPPADDSVASWLRPQVPQFSLCRRTGSNKLYKTQLAAKRVQKTAVVRRLLIEGELCALRAGAVELGNGLLYSLPRDRIPQIPPSAAGGETMSFCVALGNRAAGVSRGAAARSLWKGAAAQPVGRGGPTVIVPGLGGDIGTSVSRNLSST
jgi:hypothetical protein